MKIRHDTLLSFGKYEGSKISDVLNEDPGYILWLDETTDYIISNSLYEEAKEYKENEYEPIEHWYDIF